MHVFVSLYSGLHQAIIHNKPAMLNRLLDFVAQYPQLEQSVNDQNALFQVCVCVVALHTPCLLKREDCHCCLKNLQVLHE